MSVRSSSFVTIADLFLCSPPVLRFVSVVGLPSPPAYGQNLLSYCVRFDVRGDLQVSAGSPPSREYDTDRIPNHVHGGARLLGDVLGSRLAGNRIDDGLGSRARVDVSCSL